MFQQDNVVFVRCAKWPDNGPYVAVRLCGGQANVLLNQRVMTPGSVHVTVSIYLFILKEEKYIYITVRYASPVRTRHAVRLF